MTEKSIENVFLSTTHMDTRDSTVYETEVNFFSQKQEPTFYAQVTFCIQLARVYEHVKKFWDKPQIFFSCPCCLLYAECFYCAVKIRFSFIFGKKTGNGLWPQ